jgi:hypothetical protein
MKAGRRSGPIRRFAETTSNATGYGCDKLPRPFAALLQKFNSAASAL